ncbi:MAG: GGDEF domain-containing protein [Caldimicrobium sp.]|nr:GGDEF domain-containing protein [Caldimicrobium sp.]MCX7873350.1 GGDEF domain-containing protein [Caldimicrobium sp.]MDW8093412.1 GGDEF domain-containing protein [Caldimicrobium sp.]
MGLAAVKKKIIFSYLEKANHFDLWRECLKGSFKIKVFNKLEKFFEAILFNPPDLIFYHYKKSPQGLEVLIKDIKVYFNLVRLPLVVILDEFDLSIKKYLHAVDDIILTTAKPEEVLLRAELCLMRIERISDNNPLTGLPGNVSIEKTLQQILLSDTPFGVAYADLDNFKAYNDLYGFTKGDELIKNVARILTTTVNAYTKEGFVGHVGGDDFVYIVPLELVENISQEVIKKFSLILPTFLTKEDLERGYFITKDRLGKVTKVPLPSISIAIVPVTKGKFKHLGEIVERAAQVKKVVKAMTGSAYFLDRRS